MYADNEIENHAEGKRQGGKTEYKERSSFAEDFNDDKGFQTVVCDETD
jgi:hypothetical protein